jgi:hypothetical protein
MNCGTCKHWALVGRLGQHGYGQCAMRPEPIRSAFTTSAQNMCRLGKFKKAEPAVVQAREFAQGQIL